MKLSKLQEVPLREIWQHEALDFTQWLVKEENLSLLAQTLQLDLTDAQSEYPLGSFKADILAKDYNDHYVIIENQLEQTDHTHLGQNITYASGIEAKYIVWIVKTAREEHQQAIQWLNQRTDSQANFFLIELKAFKIDNSLPAPQFKLVVAPNDWSKIVRAHNTTQASAFEKQTFFEEFIAYTSQQDYEALNHLKLPRLGYSLSVRLNQDLEVLLMPSAKFSRVMAWIPNNKELFYLLRASQVEIEKDLQVALAWREYVQGASLALQHSGQLDDLENRPVLIKWAYQTMTKMMKILPKYLAD